MNNIQHILSSFDPISLKEMDGVKLMDRTDTKFTFNITQLEDVLKKAKEFYRVLSIENNRISRYKTLYFDTEDFELYNKHHSGKLNRYKIRHRTYVESNIGFLEVKYKNNRGRTIKTRIKENQIPSFENGNAKDFLLKSIPYQPSLLVPKIWINYSRITLVNKTSAERLTIDLYLEFEKDKETKLLDKLVIAEVKQDSKIASPFIAIMKELHIREGSISKYCMAIANSYTTVKKNNFKQKLQNIQKITNL